MTKKTAYVSPATQVVELKTETALLTGSQKDYQTYNMDEDDD